MATRARIGIELKNGSVLSVYHHWDGYPEWLGRILNTHYNDRAKVAELIDGGDFKFDIHNTNSIIKNSKERDVRLFKFNKKRSCK